MDMTKYNITGTKYKMPGIQYYKINEIADWN